MTLKTLIMRSSPTLPDGDRAEGPPRRGDADCSRPVPEHPQGRRRPRNRQLRLEEGPHQSSRIQPGPKTNVRHRQHTRTESVASETDRNDLRDPPEPPNQRPTHPPKATP